LEIDSEINDKNEFKCKEENERIEKILTNYKEKYSFLINNLNIPIG
jgi:hypothetical protein